MICAAVGTSPRPVLRAAPGPAFAWLTTWMSMRAGGRRFAISVAAGIGEASSTMRIRTCSSMSCANTDSSARVSTPAVR
jgi:hypothetical protein